MLVRFGELDCDWTEIRPGELTVQPANWTNRSVPSKPSDSILFYFSYMRSCSHCCQPLEHRFASSTPPKTLQSPVANHSTPPPPALRPLQNSSTTPLPKTLQTAKPRHRPLNLPTPRRAPQAQLQNSPILFSPPKIPLRFAFLVPTAFHFCFLKFNF